MMMTQNTPFCIPALFKELSGGGREKSGACLRIFFLSFSFSRILVKNILFKTF